MIKTNKLVALGLLAAVGLNFAVAPAVSAAGTDVLYNPGQTSGGGNGGGSGDGSGVANWTVDYPVAIQVDDGATTFQTAKKMTFNLFNTKPDGTPASEKYTGDKSVTIKLGANSKAITAEGENKGAITMTAAGTGSASPIVRVSTKGAKDVENKINALTSGASSEVVATLKSESKGGATTSDAFVYLAKKDGLKGDSYKTTLTWDITAQ